MDESITESSTAAAPVLEQSPEPPTLGPRRRRWVLPLLLAPVVLVVLVVAAWAIDTSRGGVPRNVRLVGTNIGGLSEDELTARVVLASKAFATTRVEVVAGSATYRTTAGDLGVIVDEERTVEAALDVDKRGFLLARPIGWVRSFFTTRRAELRLQVSDEQLDATVVELEGAARTAPTEPSVEVVDGALHVVPGADGRGIVTGRLAKQLPQAAADAEPDQVIRVTAALGPIPPLGSLEDARAAVSEAETRVGEPIVIQTTDGDRTIAPEVLRSWLTLVSHLDGTVSAIFAPDRVATSLRAAFADIDGQPVDASFTVDGGVPVIRPDRPGRVCCGDDPASRIDAALRVGDRSLTLPLVEGPASFTTADARALGITQAVGGSNAWRSGAPTTAGPGFTTYHSASGARVINIHRIADLVRGAVIPPGGQFSINKHVGKRTVAKGFVSAGAIANGEHVDEIGGGISQFATTAFNAAFFAGLDIDEYQAHSEYFDRYPRGREATMGYPSPDLKFTNNTPYGILIWTSYTSTSLTVTLYSTPYATAEQTGITQGASGACTIVTTTRTRTYPDGHTETDKFRARYRPGPGQGC